MNRFLTIAVIGCAALTTIATAGVVQAGAATASSPAPVRKIVYAAEGGGIGLVNADGSGNHQISAVTANSVSFSPNGSQIAYTSAGQLWTKSVSGGSARQLTHASGGASGATWSPNGRWIAFASNVGSRFEIFRVAATGGSMTRLTSAPGHGCSDEQAAWSPDSTTIAYVRDTNGNPSCTAGGLVVQRIGHAGTIVVPGVVSSPSFTPVGNLVYMATCAGCVGDVGWEANADGSAQTIVDMHDDCIEGDRCLEAMIGAARVHGWVENSSYGSEDGPSGTCFFGEYQQAGVVNGMPPGVCMDNVFVDPGASDVD